MRGDEALGVYRADGEVVAGMRQKHDGPLAGAVVNSGIVAVRQGASGATSFGYSATNRSWNCFAVRICPCF